MGKLSTFFVMAFLGFGLSSCGGEAELAGPEGQITSTAMATVLASTAFTDFSAAVLPKATGAISLPFSSSPGNVGQFDGTSVRPLAANYTACTSSTGSTTDGTDADSIPLSFSQVFSCNGIDNGFGTSTFTGSYSVTDKDDTKYGILGGFRFDADFTFADNMSHEVNEGSFGGYWDVTVGSTTITSANNYRAMVGSTPTSGTPPASKYSMSSKFDVVYTPANMALPWAAGSISLNGFYRLSGVIYDGVSTQHDLAVAFEISTSGLTYNRTDCPAGGYKDGSMTFTDGAGNRLVFSYNSCTLTRQFNGQSI